MFIKNNLCCALKKNTSNSDSCYMGRLIWCIKGQKSILSKTCILCCLNEYITYVLSTLLCKGLYRINYGNAKPQIHCPYAQFEYTRNSRCKLYFYMSWFTIIKKNRRPLVHPLKMHIYCTVRNKQCPVRCGECLMLKNIGS